MTSPIFIDTNVPVYAGGREHPMRQPCVAVLTLAAMHSSAFVTDAEVLQELLHLYRAIGAWSRGQIVFDGFVAMMKGRVMPFTAQDAELAGTLVDQYGQLSARDLAHIAVMTHAEIDVMVSVDQSFDRVTNLRRLDPADVQLWRTQFGW